MGGYLTMTQDQVLGTAITSYQDSVKYGHILIHEPWTYPQRVSTDVVVFGWTSGGAAAAYQAAKLGRSVAWIGGGLDHYGSIGGMSASGLGYADLQNTAAVGGFPRWMFTLMSGISGASDTVAAFEPRNFRSVMKGLFDPARTNGASGITLYSTYGVGLASVTKTGTTITRVTTTDGRIFTGKQFIDASEEVDLAYLAGCTIKVGREAATGSGVETIGGYRSTSSAFQGLQFTYGGRATQVPVDPYVTQGNSASGILPGLVLETETLGQADNGVMAYNYRCAMTTNTLRDTANHMATAYPSGFSAADYELLFRQAAAATTASGTLQSTDVITINSAGAYNDINNNGAFSTDYVGEQNNYVSAGQNIQGRIASSQRHWNYIRGFLYALDA